jgi:CRP/FNR family transcriptional regulator
MTLKHRDPDGPFNGLIVPAQDTAELFFLKNIERRQIYPVGGIVIWAGFPNILCAHVVAGNLKMTASTLEGREQIVSLLFAGDFVGQIFTEESRFTVTALVETELSLYDRASFEYFLDTHPAYAHGFLRRISASLGDARARMLTLGQCDAHVRIAAFLIDLLDRVGLPDTAGLDHFEIPFSRGDMADYLGTTIETVSRHLTSLKGIGAIELMKGGRSVAVLDRHLLEEALLQP